MEFLTPPRTEKTNIHEISNPTDLTSPSPQNWHWQTKSKVEAYYSANGGK
jgi:hypothetical protein|tara:strand:- start:1982 stop:2131 length:150 start_codon:yes stop_codon:yes gene_type:complete